MKKKITLNDYGLFVEAWLFLAIARLLLLFVAFKRIAPLLGKTVYENKKTAQSFSQTELFHSMCIAIARGSYYSFWRTKCFEQALAVKMMLRRRGLISIIYFGVYKNLDNNKINAHA